VEVIDVKGVEVLADFEKLANSRVVDSGVLRE
jgi:hypothetical protein